MRLQTAGEPVHLTYCTNIHPGEAWHEVRDNIQRHVVQVKRQFCPEQPFCVGLRLSGQAAAELDHAAAQSELSALLAAEDLYVVTINGFPHGTFHGRAVKERVYLPDWRSPERVAYSDRLARLLAAVLPADANYGSVSTVPGAFKAALSGPDDLDAIAENLVQHAARLTRLREQTGKTIVLALEPEPCCLLETIAETTAFFERHLRAERAVARMATLTGLPRHAAAAALDRHVGVCLDACHAAVEFEQPAEMLAQLARANIHIAKLQLSSALRIDRMTAATREALVPYLDEVYLHQVVARRAGRLSRYADLPEALEHDAWQTEDSEWRIHFHVPLFIDRMRAFGTTQAFLLELLSLHRRAPISQHLEIETYTWGVLPDELMLPDLTTAITRELAFCLSALTSPAD